MTPTVTGTDYMPKWVIYMATDYARREGLSTIAVQDYFKTADYRDTARRGEAAAQRVDDADVRANNDESDSPVDDKTPKHPGCIY